MVANELTGEKGSLIRLGGKFGVLRDLSRVHLAQRTRMTVGVGRNDGKKHVCTRAGVQMG